MQLAASVAMTVTEWTDDLNESGRGSNPACSVEPSRRRKRGSNPQSSGGPLERTSILAHDSPRGAA